MTSGSAGVGGPPRVAASKGALVFSRYYHLFPAGELEALVGRMHTTCRLVSCVYDKSNWVATIEKL
jgi:hypothetical protein